MNKGTKVALLILAALALLCVVGVWSMFTNVQRELDTQRAQAVDAGNEILVLVASGWDPAAFELRTAADFEQNVGDVPARLAEWSDQFGSLVSGQVELDAFRVESAGDDPLLVAEVASEAEFDKGPAMVEMTLTREPGNSWMLSDLDVRPLP